MAIKAWILQLRFATRRMKERRQWDTQTINSHTGAQSQNIYYLMQAGLLTENCFFQRGKRNVCRSHGNLCQSA